MIHFSTPRQQSFALLATQLALFATADYIKRHYNEKIARYFAGDKDDQASVEKARRVTDIALAVLAVGACVATILWFIPSQEPAGRVTSFWRFRNPSLEPAERVTYFWKLPNPGARKILADYTDRQIGRLTRCVLGHLTRHVFGRLTRRILLSQLRHPLFQ